MNKPEQVAWKMRLQVSIEPERETMYAHGRLNLSEEYYISVGDFLELASVLHQFHQLAQKVMQKPSA